MKPLPAFLLGYGVGVGTLLLLPRLHAVALGAASLLLRRVETHLARAEARRQEPGHPLAGARTAYFAPKRARNMPTRSSSSSTSST